MSDFSINVHIDLGVTPEVVALVGSILAGHSAPAQLLTTEEQPVIKLEPTVSTTKKRKNKAAAETQSEPVAEQPTEDAAPVETPSESEEIKPLTEEDVRAAMHKTRQRIEGEDYKENVESESYKKYHKVLTATFKNISALLGSDRPSALPEDKRAYFIGECNALEILEDGSIGKRAVF